MLNLDKGDTRLIIKTAKTYGLLRNQLAYVLATTYLETAFLMTPVREMGGEKYLKNKPYYPYVGMGYIQITWEDNVRRAGEMLGVDFISDPKKLLTPKYAVLILIRGMQEGWFTGKKLSDYITLQKSDFLNARKIVNGMDKASKFANIANEYNKLLLAADYGISTSEDVATEPLSTPPRAKAQKIKGWSVAGLFALLAYVYSEYKEQIHDFINSFSFW